VALVDDDMTKHGRHVHGVKVYGACDDIPRIAQECRAEQIVLRCQADGQDALTLGGQRRGAGQDDLLGPALLGPGPALRASAHPVHLPDNGPEDPHPPERTGPGPAG